MKKTETILLISAFLLTFIVTKQINVMQDTEEIWVPFTDCPHFIISNTGRLINTNTKHERKLSLNNKGYLGFTLFRGKKGYRMHVCVAEHFIQKPKSHEKLVVNHRDSNPKNNNWKNLEWCTQKENMRHAVMSGRFTNGSKRIGAKLSELSVLVIREARSLGFPYKDIAAYFMVSQTAIYNANKGVRWRYVK